MQYEVYADVYIIVNFMMNVICLSLVRVLLFGRGSPKEWHRIFAGALLGSIGSLLVFAIPKKILPEGGIVIFRVVLLHGVVNTSMLKIALKIPWSKKRFFLKAYAGLYVSSFLVGGVMEVLTPYIRMSSLFFAVTLASYYLILGIYEWLRRMHQQESIKLSVELWVKERPSEGEGSARILEGIIDTGNGLMDPVTGKPVSIISREAASKFLGDVSANGIRYIPCKTVSGEGVMPVIELENMRLTGLRNHQQATTVIQKPLIGISWELSYDIIVSPKLW